MPSVESNFLCFLIYCASGCTIWRGITRVYRYYQCVSWISSFHRALLRWRADIMQHHLVVNRWHRRRLYRSLSPPVGPTILNRDYPEVTLELISIRAVFGFSRWSDAKALPWEGRYQAQVYVEVLDLSVLKPSTCSWVENNVLVKKNSRMRVRSSSLLLNHLFVILFYPTENMREILDFLDGKMIFSVSEFLYDF